MITTSSPRESDSPLLGPTGQPAQLDQTVIAALPNREPGGIVLPGAEFDRFVFTRLIDYPFDEEEHVIVEATTPAEAPDVLHAHLTGATAATGFSPAATVSRATVA